MSSAPARAEALNAKLEQFERDTSNQLLVWADRKLPEGFTLEDFTVRAGQKWGAGQKKEDNGAVLFVFTEDRKVRIEVGYGLEGAIPDAIAKRIIDEQIVPRFRAGDYPGGVDAGAEAMMAAAKGEYRGTGRTVDEGRPTPGPARAARSRRSSSASSSCSRSSTGAGAVSARTAAGLLDGRRRLGGGGWSGGGFGGVAAGGGGGGGGFSGGAARSAAAAPRELVGRWRAFFEVRFGPHRPGDRLGRRPDLRRDPRPRHPARARRTSRSARCGASTSSA